MLKTPVRNFTHYGYRYLAQINSFGRRGWHPGLDYNKGDPYQDLGEPVYALGRGVVEYVKPISTSAWGKVIVIRYTFYDESNLERIVWGRYAHLQFIVKVDDEKEGMRFLRTGDEVDETVIIGAVGKTGTKYPHLHADVFKQNPNRNYLQYTWGMSREQVKRKYADIEFMMKHWNYEQKPSLSDWAKDGWNWAKGRKLDEGIIPRALMGIDPMATQKIEKLFVELGGFKKIEGEISWERFLTGAMRIYKKIENNTLK